MGGQPNTTVDDKMLREHSEEWTRFTRFMTAGIIMVVLLLLAFMLHFFIGWGYSMAMFVFGCIVTTIAHMLGKI